MNAWWQEQGYLYGRDIGDGMWICVAEMIFTWRLMLCTPDYVHDFYCYPKTELPLALSAAAQWDGESEPLPGWTRHFGAKV